MDTDLYRHFSAAREVCLDGGYKNNYRDCDPPTEILSGHSHNSDSIASSRSDNAGGNLTSPSTSLNESASPPTRLRTRQFSQWLGSALVQHDSAVVVVSSRDEEQQHDEDYDTVKEDPEDCDDDDDKGPPVRHEWKQETTTPWIDKIDAGSSKFGCNGVRNGGGSGAQQKRRGVGGSIVRGVDCNQSWPAASVRRLVSYLLQERIYQVVVHANRSRWAAMRAPQSCERLLLAELPAQRPLSVNELDAAVQTLAVVENRDLGGE